MNINKRERVLGMVAIGAVVFYVAVQLIFTPLTNLWHGRTAEIAKLKQDFRNGMVSVNRENAIRDQWNQMHTNTLAITKPEAESQMLKAFQRWSDASNVSVSSIRPQWKEDEDAYNTLECRADVAGNLLNLTRFLYQIEKDPLGVKVDTLDLTARDNNGQQITLALQVSGLQLNPPKKR